MYVRVSCHCGPSRNCCSSGASPCAVRPSGCGEIAWVRCLPPIFISRGSAVCAIFGNWVVEMGGKRTLRTEEIEIAGFRKAVVKSFQRRQARLAILGREKLQFGVCLKARHSLPSAGSSDTEATIDQPRGAGDIRSQGAGEEQHHRGDFRGFGLPP